MDGDRFYVRTETSQASCSPGQGEQSVIYFETKTEARRRYERDIAEGQPNQNLDVYLCRLDGRVLAFSPGVCPTCYGSGYSRGECYVAKYAAFDREADRLRVA